MKQKARHSGKRKTDSSTRKRSRKLHTSEYEKFMLHKKKIALYSKKDIIDYNQQCHPLHLGNEQYKQFPQKRKKSQEREREREREEERVRTGGKRRRKRRRKRREEKIRENGESGIKVLL